MDYDAALAWMFGLPRYTKSRDLKRVRALLERLDHPERAFTPVHVAGTNGKGSTAAALAALVTASGKRAGLYTSPHLHRFNERVRVDGVMIPDEDVARLATRVREAVDALVAKDPDLAPAGFDAFTALAFLWFKEQGVDVAVLEAGIGGRLDATNAFGPSHAAPVTVLTNVGLEHADVLGGTRAVIAREKLALAQPGTTLVTAETDADVLAEVDAAADEREFRVVRVGEDVTVRVRESTFEGVRFDYASRSWTLEDVAFPLAGKHQALNAACALAAAEALQDAGVTTWSPDALRHGLAATRWPGRLDTLARDPLTITDAAHNPHGVAALVDSIRNLTLAHETTLVLGVSADKAFDEMLPRLLPLADRLILTRPARNGLPVQDLLDAVARALPQVPENRIQDVDVRENVADAVHLARLVTPRAGLVLVLGGLFLAAEARAAFDADA